MKNLFKILALVIAPILLNSCDEYEAGSEVNSPLSYGFEKLTVNVEIEEADPIYPVKVYSTQVVDYDRTILFEIDPTSTALTSDYEPFTSNSIVIPAGSNFGSIDMQFNHENLSLASARVLKLNLIQPDDATAVALTTSTTSISYKAKCVNNLVELSLILDRWGSETTWEITKDGVPVASGGPYTDTSTNALQAEKKFTLCLEDGSYVFTINDAYGDGMYTAAGVVGSYQITSNGSVVVSRQTWGDGTRTYYTRSVNFTL
ncbi:hypothetical protein [Flavobacterium sp.]|uniref:hypothetical protein n=1 Tax=Flavobacterium sp. TaxID=239 RepID=UPI0040471BF4